MARFNRKSANDCKHYSLKRDGAGLRLSRNFTLIEFACKDGNDTVIIHPAIIDLVQKLRDYYGTPVNINSAYRTPAHNSAIGGATASRHLYGFAADVDVHGVSPRDVADLVDSWGAGGVGRYNTFTHCDVEGFNRRWDNT